MGEHLEIHLGGERIKHDVTSRRFVVGSNINWYGYRPGWTEMEVWERNHGCWKGLSVKRLWKGNRVVSLVGDGLVRCVGVVVATSVITEMIGDDGTYVGRVILHGYPLVGHPEVGQPEQTPSTQNPIHWVPGVLDSQPTVCGMEFQPS